MTVKDLEWGGEQRKRTVLTVAKRLANAGGHVTQLLVIASSALGG